MKQKEFKVGQKVWSARLGKCVVTIIDQDRDYPVIVENSNETITSYTAKGFNYKCDTLPSLFHKNPFKKKDKSFKPRWMMVSDNNHTFIKRYVLQYCKKKKVYYAYNKSSTDEELAMVEAYSLNAWKFAKEVKETKPSEVTIDQIAEKFEIPVDQLKIKK